MVHSIAAFVAKPPVAKIVAEALGGAPVYRLRHAEFLVVPVGDDAFDALVAERGASSAVGNEFWRLTVNLMDLARECSVHGPIAYVETDYFGGAGVQGAAAWVDGEARLPPTVEEHSVVNAALRMIGLRAEDGFDEFDTLGLGRTRRLDSFDDLTPVA
jgi:hypothetical protein